MFFSRTGDIPKSYPDSPLSAEFFIKDKNGVETDTFEVGEEINFEIKVRNISGKDLSF